ncbi:uncharacterized protein LOC135386927 [Ornithodoros turicata]|uniref:uncharacterized protein LOC135386927 n=1 Tax=Ornithodoros turicata TaxID=34597 RepID=UPI00313A21C6
MPPALMLALKKKERPSSRLRREMIRIIVSHAMRMCERPLRKHYEIIARRIVQQYPSSLQDAFDGTVVGTGHDSVLNQLVFRTENCTRSRSDTPETKGRQKKSGPYGCIRDASTEEVDEEGMAEKKEILKSWYTNSEGEGHKVIQELKSTYPLQRKMIKSKMTTRELMSEWPYLFTPEGMFTHFQLLVGVDIGCVLPISLNEKGANVLNFSKQESQKTDTVARILLEQQEAPSPAAQSEALAVTLLLLHYLDEAEDGVLLVRSEFCTARDVELSALPASPRIIALGKINFWNVYSIGGMPSVV